MKNIFLIMVLLVCAFVAFSCKPDDNGGVGPQTQPPSAPLGVSASQYSLDYIKVSWDVCSGADGYKVYRSDGSSSFSLVKTTSSTSWTDVVTKAKWYSYSVTSYNKGGESAASSTVSGYREGWRFANTKYYIPTGGIGFNFDLNVFGFKNATKAVVLYAVYKKGNSYYYVPSAAGYGIFNSVATKYLYTATTNAEEWNYKWDLKNIWWHSSYRNNTYEQYIAMKVYQSQNPQSLNDPTFEETTYYCISWSGAFEKAQPLIKRQLSQEESMKIEKQLRMVQ